MCTKKRLLGEQVQATTEVAMKLLLHESEGDISPFPFFFLFLSRSRSRGAEENTVENIRFPQETGEFSSLKVGRSLKAFGT